jgi:hypothetical protein
MRNEGEGREVARNVHGHSVEKRRWCHSLLIERRRSKEWEKGKRRRKGKREKPTSSIGTTKRVRLPAANRPTCAGECEEFAGVEFISNTCNRAERLFFSILFQLGRPASQPANHTLQWSSRANHVNGCTRLSQLGGGAAGTPQAFLSALSIWDTGDGRTNWTEPCRQRRA